MSVQYRAVQWTGYKKRYDVVLVSLVFLYLVTFIVSSKIALRQDRSISDEILILRALGTCAFVMLSLTLCIGPLARLDRRFLPLLHNRRHLGVATPLAVTRLWSFRAPFLRPLTLSFTLDVATT